jgi:hypothetical protein
MGTNDVLCMYVCTEYSVGVYDSRNINAGGKISIGHRGAFDKTKTYSSKHVFVIGRSGMTDEGPASQVAERKPWRERDNLVNYGADRLVIIIAEHKHSPKAGMSERRI